MTVVGIVLLVLTGLLLVVLPCAGVVGVLVVGIAVVVSPVTAVALVVALVRFVLALVMLVMALAVLVRALMLVAVAVSGCTGSCFSSLRVEANSDSSVETNSPCWP